MEIKNSRPIKIGIFVTVVLFAALWGIFYLKGLDLFNKESRYYVIYENIQGLEISNPVQIKGLKVGQVTKISFSNQQYKSIVVEILVKHGYKLPKGTIAKIYSSDLMGSKSIELLPSSNTTSCEDGDTLQSDIEQSLQDQVRLEVLPIKKKAESLMSSMDSIFSGLEYVLNKDTKENIMNSIYGIRKTFENLERTTKKLDTIVSIDKFSKIFENINSITSNIRQQNKNVSNILNNVSVMTDSLANLKITQTIRKANNVAESFDIILKKINNGEGTIGQLINNDSLYTQLHQASYSLDSLLKDVKMHPKRYVHFSIFGSNSDTKSHKSK